MATQGQRRTQAKNAVRKARQQYRKADSAGEKLERELDRLIKRKTMIGPDDVNKALLLVQEWLKTVDLVMQTATIMSEIISRLPL